jgi:hypothetical protein
MIHDILISWRFVINQQFNKCTSIFVKKINNNTNNNNKCTSIMIAKRTPV